MSRISRRVMLQRAAGALAAPWVASAAAGAGDAPVAPEAKQRPNILLISFDTLRASHTGLFGYERPTSPNLDRLAAEGAVFRHAYSTSAWTSPAHASVFTGLYPPAHGIQGPKDVLPPEAPTLARQFKAAGYATKAIISGPMADRRFRFDLGFDDFDDHTYVGRADFSRIKDDKGREEVLLYGVHAADTIRQVACEWLRSAPPEPWFLFVHLWDAHADYKAPAPYATMFDPDYTGPVDGTIKAEKFVNKDMPERDLRHFIARYDGGVAWTDHQLGLLLESLGALGLRDKTCVALFSDHGEEFFEHGTKGHAHNLYESLIHVPVVVRWPGRIAGGTEIDTAISLTDLAPTLLDLGGIRYPDWMQGRSLEPLLSGREKSLPEVPLYSALYFRGREQLSVQVRPIKLINDIKTRGLELYNLSADPTELRNLYSQTPELGTQYFDRLTTWWAECEQLALKVMGRTAQVETEVSSLMGGAPRFG